MAKIKNADVLTLEYDDYYPYRLEQIDERALRKEFPDFEGKFFETDLAEL